MNNWSLRKTVLLLTSIVLLAAGGTMLIWQLTTTAPGDGNGTERHDALTAVHAAEPVGQSPGPFTTESLDRYTYHQDGKDLFSLLIARYRDGGDAEHRAILFPRESRDSAFATSPTGLRHDIWEAAAKAIAAHAPEDALILSWWDDGQRIHYLGGRDAWLRKASAESFVTPVWKPLQGKLPEAQGEEKARLGKMARWLTMESEEALADMAEFFGKSRPIYILVTNDLLLRLGEIEAYGGASLPLTSKSIPAGDNLHGDIAQVKRWAFEVGDGNYLVQKEGRYYRVWSTPAGSGKNTLLVRLLPFVESLKNLPDGVKRVYQSGWGAFLSIYSVDFDPLRR